MVVALVIFAAAIVAIGGIATQPTRGIAFASVKPYAVGGHNQAIYWKPSPNFDENFFSANLARVKLRSRVFCNRSRFATNCWSDIAFKVYLGMSEIASVYDYTCGLFSIGISTTYVHTIPVEAKDTLSVKYVGGGKLYMEDSFMDVLLLPPTPQ
ncbi:uncharacterized protein KRP23_1673 [Phytophthora ramorum]|uniref:uncharacterized protein n=1 Tax=Phytophthora ramorum TaxID=164328 RepID=UPI0030AE080E|nr:hypothetical protein KRP23_1673 [Phytophthora ramorum]